jgi:hypothetical protein
MIPAGTPLGAVQVELPGAPVIGQVAPGGQHVKLGKLEGWWDAPSSSGTATQKVNGHGAFLGPAFYGPRVVIAEARVDGFSPADSLAVARQLMSSLSVDALTRLSVTDDLGATLTADVRQEGDPILVRSGNRMVVSLSMLAPDPRRYGPWQSISTGLPVASGGFTLPVTLPIIMNGTGAVGAVSVTNEGDMEAPLVFTVAGPCPPFSISDQFGNQLSYWEDVPEGRTVDIDTDARVVLLDGTANRVVTGTWPTLQPGANTFQFSASAYDAGALLTVSYRSAWR